LQVSDLNIIIVSTEGLYQKRYDLRKHQESLSEEYDPNEKICWILTSTVSALMTKVIPILPAGALHNLQAEQERNRKALQGREHFITVHME